MGKATLAQLSVQFNNSKYPLFIGTDILPKIGELLELYKFSTNIVLLIDNNLKGGYSKTLLDCFKIPVKEIFIDGNESIKNIQTVSRLCEIIISQKQQPDTIIAFGGGVIADIAGFMAHILNPPLKFIQIPSTLSAQVDTVISDKAFLNSKYRRNNLAIPSPLNLAWSDVGLLRTLSMRHLISGLIYISKLSILDKGDLLQYLEQHLDVVEALEFKFIEEIVKKSCEIKIKLMKNSERKNTLLFGTLIAKSLEEVFNYEDVTPGEALLYGMLIESLISLRAGILNNNDFERIFNLFNQLKKKIKIPEIDPGVLISHLRNKVKNHRFFFPVRIGEFIAVDDFDENILYDSIKIIKMKY